MLLTGQAPALPLALLTLRALLAASLALLFLLPTSRRSWSEVPAKLMLAPHTSAYVSIRQHTPALLPASRRSWSEVSAKVMLAPHKRVP
jgi:hypothetical protein